VVVGADEAERIDVPPDHVVDPRRHGHLLLTINGPLCQVRSAVVGPHRCIPRRQEKRKVCWTRPCGWPATTRPSWTAADRTIVLDGAV
jgi:hypothetical protein